MFEYYCTSLEFLAKQKKNLLVTVILRHIIKIYIILTEIFFLCSNFTMRA